MFEPVVRGRVWKFGDNVSTDAIKPGFVRDLPPEGQAKACMQAIRPEFAGLVRPGDIVLGGRNFGCGSARPAAQSFMTLGIACAVAETFSRLFLRSSVSLGFPVLGCAGVAAAFAEGDVLEADFALGLVRNLTTGVVLRTEPLPEMPMAILRAGGVVALLRAEAGQKRTGGK